MRHFHDDQPQSAIDRQHPVFRHDLPCHGASAPSASRLECNGARPDCGRPARRRLRVAFVGRRRTQSALFCRAIVGRHGDGGGLAIAVDQTTGNRPANRDHADRRDLLPIAGICAIPFALQTPPLQPIALDWRIQAHAWLALFSYAALSVATITALMLAAQERRLRQRRALIAQSVLPPLIQIESLLFRLLQAAFLLLTLTLLSGALFIEDLFAQHLVHKTVLSILSWIVLGVLLAGRYRYGWGGIATAGGDARPFV